MKRAWRFVKWAFAKWGWWESLMFTISFCMGAGAVADLNGRGDIRNVFWIVAVSVILIAMLRFMWWGIKNFWNEFKKHDEQVFDILKQKDIK